MTVATIPEGGVGRPVQQTIVPSTAMVDAKYLADYRPAFRMGAVRSDAEGNLWVRTTEPTDRGAIHYVINAKGQLIDRVQLPYGRVVAGFAAGVVFMGVEDDAGVRLERARIR
jgi:sugar lactone lactonase YvrE